MNNSIGDYRSDLSNKRAFTLVELLVAIAISGILAALLLPALSMAKAQARSTICKGRLKQMGVALQIYVQENRGRYPYLRCMMSPTETNSAASLDNIWWCAKLQPYTVLKWTNRASHCPGYNGAISAGGRPPRGSYAYNSRGVWLEFDHTGRGYQIRYPRVFLGLGSDYGSQWSRLAAVSDSQIVAPSEMFAIGESRFLNPQSNRDNGGASVAICGGIDEDYFAFDPARHGKNYNQLYCDSHVGSMNPRILFDPARTGAMWNIDHQPHPEYWRR